MSSTSPQANKKQSKALSGANNQKQPIVQVRRSAQEQTPPLIGTPTTQQYPNHGTYNEAAVSVYYVVHPDVVAVSYHAAVESHNVAVAAQARAVESYNVAVRVQAEAEKAKAEAEKAKAEAEKAKVMARTSAAASTQAQKPPAAVRKAPTPAALEPAKKPAAVVRKLAPTPAALEPAKKPAAVVRKLAPAALEPAKKPAAAVRKLAPTPAAVRKLAPTPAAVRKLAPTPAAVRKLAPTPAALEPAKNRFNCLRGKDDSDSDNDSMANTNLQSTALKTEATHPETTQTTSKKKKKKKPRPHGNAALQQSDAITLPTVAQEVDNIGNNRGTSSIYDILERKTGINFNDPNSMYSRHGSVDIEEIQHGKKTHYVVRVQLSSFCPSDTLKSFKDLRKIILRFDDKKFKEEDIKSDAFDVELCNLFKSFNDDNSEIAQMLFEKLKKVNELNKGTEDCDFVRAIAQRELRRKTARK